MTTPQGQDRPSSGPDPDIQRPLDESAPIIEPPAAPSRPAAAELRSAVPVTEPPAELRSAMPAPDQPLDVAGMDPPTGFWRGRRRAPGRVSRLSRTTRRWARRPAGRLVLPGALIAALVGLTGFAGVYLVPPATAGDGTALTVLPGGPGPAVPSGTAVPTPPGAAPTAAPAPPPAVTPGATPQPTGRPADVLRDWAAQMSTRTGVPVTALQAYGYAEVVLAQTTPACRLSWTTLAAIGRVESNHGRTNGATLLPDGRAVPAIIGAPLDGREGRELITDTDGGALDGDLTYDRAVGPMQFIPSTWRLEAVDADGDGIADPNDIDDASLAAATYLCRHSRDLGTAAGWWAAVLAYNNVPAYAAEVFAAANEYGQLSRLGVD